MAHVLGQSTSPPAARRGEEGTFTRYGYPRYPQRGEQPRDIEFMRGCFMSARREAATKVRFDEQMAGYALGEDEDFSYRLSRLGRVHYEPGIVVEHRKLGFAAQDPRRFGRLVVVNRAYLFRKNLTGPCSRARSSACSSSCSSGIGSSTASGAGHKVSSRVPRRPGATDVDLRAGHLRLVPREGGRRGALPRDARREPRPEVGTGGGLPRGRPARRAVAPRRIPTEVLATSPRLPGIVRSAWKLRGRLSRGDQHVLHANGIKAAFVATLAAVRTGTPVVWVKHDFSYDGALAGLVAARCREVIGVSAAVRETFSGDVRGKVRVIHNGIAPAPVDREAGRSRMLEALGPPAATAVVALVARLDPVKGHRELLASAPELAEALPGLRIAFVGGTSPPHPAYSDELRREVAAAGLEDVVALLGHRDDAESADRRRRPRRDPDRRRLARNGSGGFLIRGSRGPCRRHSGRLLCPRRGSGGGRGVRDARSGR